MKWKKDYLNEFRPDESGKYSYQGKFYGFAGDEAERKKAYTNLWLLFAAAAAAALISGSLSGGGITNTFYVIIPYIGEVSALFALVWNQSKLLKKGGEVREYVYNAAHPKIPTAAMLLAFFAIVGGLLSLVFSIASGFQDGVLNAVLYVVLKAVSAALALFYRKYFSRLEWIKI